MNNENQNNGYQTPRQQVRGLNETELELAINPKKSAEKTPKPNPENTKADQSNYTKYQDR